MKFPIVMACAEPLCHPERREGSAFPECLKRMKRGGLLFTSLLLGLACHPPSAEWQLAAHEADSTKRVLAERNRGSAGQMVEFPESERPKYARVENMIQARFAGVEVTPRGSGFAIKIRGTGSFTSSNEPLFIVDGSVAQSGTLNRISPLDVERIEVVKDGMASFYGSRGANGVIVITTRRGR